MAKERKLKGLNNETKTAQKVLKEQVEKLKEQQKRLEEIEELKKQALQEETALLESTRQKINEIAEENGMFCGIILDIELLKKLIELMIGKGENVKIPFGLYFTESLED